MSYNTSETSFLYDPEFQTIIKYNAGKEISRLSAQQDELPALGEYLWKYLKDKAFKLEILTKQE